MNRPNRDPSRRPTHPGALLRLDVLPALGITQEQFAVSLGVSRLTVSQLLNEHRALSASMAVRLERTLGTSAEHWLAMQQRVDLWEARREINKPAARTDAFNVRGTAGAMGTFCQLFDFDNLPSATGVMVGSAASASVIPLVCRSSPQLPENIERGSTIAMSNVIQFDDTYRQPTQQLPHAPLKVAATESSSSTSSPIDLGQFAINAG